MFDEYLEEQHFFWSHITFLPSLRRMSAAIKTFRASYTRLFTFYSSLPCNFYLLLILKYINLISEIQNVPFLLLVDLLLICMRFLAKNKLCLLLLNLNVLNLNLSFLSIYPYDFYLIFRHLNNLSLHSRLQIYSERNYYIFFHLISLFNIRSQIFMAIYFVFRYLFRYQIQVKLCYYSKSSEINFKMDSQ